MEWVKTDGLGERGIINLQVDGKEDDQIYLRR
jgi:hypothetical protein